MALKILNSEEMLQARWNQPRMKRAEVARQIQATMSVQQSGAPESNVKPKRSRVGRMRVAS